MTAATAIEHFGTTQQELLRQLLRHPDGLGVEGLVSVLGISTNAVRQHLTALQRDGFVGKGDQRPTTRRPQQLFRLTEQGRELFPRHYSLLADKVMTHTRAAVGADGLTRIMREMGKETGAQNRVAVKQDAPAATAKQLAKVMTRVGYEASPATSGTRPEVIAHNCVFHHLAARFPEVCEYDLAFIRQATGGEVEHTECMVRGGKVCRFVLKPRR